MHTEAAFQEAEKQGYRCNNRIIACRMLADARSERPTIETDRDYFYTLHDPAFWRALGAARGWSQVDRYPRWNKEEGTSLIIFYPDNSWASWMHRYIDHVVEHGPTNHQEFFAQLYGN